MRKFYNKRQASLLLSWHKFYSWLNFSFCVRLPRSVKNQLSSQIFPQTEPRATYSRRRCRWACIWSSPRGPWCPPVRTRPWSTGWSRSCCGPGRAESPERADKVRGAIQREGKQVLLNWVTISWILGNNYRMDIMLPLTCSPSIAVWLSGSLMKYCLIWPELSTAIHNKWKPFIFTPDLSVDTIKSPPPSLGQSRDQSQYNNIIQLRFSSITKHCTKSRNNISEIISQNSFDRFKFDAMAYCLLLC